MPEQKSDFECLSKLNMALFAMNGADRENFGELLRTVYEAPHGRDVMNETAFKGYTFMYDVMPGVNGACDFESKTVKLDAYHRQSDLAPILVHESAHVLQVSRLGEKTDNAAEFINALNPRDFIKLNRAFEADACAHQAAYAYQMKDKNPALFEKEMQTPMTRAYAAEMEKSGDETKAMRAGFQAWYGYKKYQDAYEKQFVLQLTANAKKHPLTQRIAGKDIAALCLSGGKPYMTADFIDKAENVAVSSETKEALGAIGKSLPVRGKVQTVNSALLKAAIQTAGR